MKALSVLGTRPEIVRLGLTVAKLSDWMEQVLILIGQNDDFRLSALFFGGELVEVSTDFHPLISIVIPVYNGADYLKLAIDSALAQTYPHVEVVVVNDGSNDKGESELIAASYGERIKYFAKPNGGVATALNFGIQKMRGDYFSWLSHDDLYLPEKLATQVDFLRNHPTAVEKHSILYSDFEEIDSEGRTLRTNSTLISTPETVAIACLRRYPLHGCSLLIPAACFREVGLFDEALRTTQDIDLWFRFARRFAFIHQPKPLIQSRVHGQQGSVTIPYHGREVNELYTRVLDGLEPREAALASDNCNSPAWGFYSLARSLCFSKRAGKAARHALVLAWKNRTSETGGSLVRLGAASMSMFAFSFPFEFAFQCFRSVRRKWLWYRSK